MINDPLLENLLLSYAAGNLGAHESLVVATWMTLNAAARRKVAAFEALGGRVLEDEAPADLCGSCLESVLARIETPEPPPARKAAPEYAGIPDPLYSLLCRCESADIGCWSKDADVQRMAVRIGSLSAGRRELFLMKIAPNRAVPVHRHAAPEITLVLEGDYSDAFGCFKKGDICVIADTVVAHSPVAGAAGCLCLVLMGPARAQHPLQKFLRLFGR